jgi:serine phosphatase RsbU (regulator of sigma subunit)
MVEEVNKAIFRRYVEEVTNRGNLELADEIFDRYLAHQPGGLVLERGPEDVKRFNGEFRSAFHNFRLSIDEQIAEGDKVVSRITVRGTHQREFRGMAPTGKEIELKGITIFRFSPEGKVVETWDSYDQLSLMRHSVEQELQVARSIQQASLPKEVPQLEGWQISPFYRPAREVGGDFYDFFELQEGRVGVVVGDATGKGMPAALVAGAASNMLRAVAQALGSSSSPGEVLAQVNETLLARIPANMFVTCFYAIVEDESGRLLYANAGHNLPCCRRDDEHAAATTTTTDLSARGMPLGIMPQMNYEEKESVLVPGEGVLFYTDGLVEAHNSQGEMFGTPRLRSLLSERPEAGRGLSATLMEELERFTGKGWEQEDDITLLTLERSANRS